jgi:DNA modification methylase
MIQQIIIADAFEGLKKIPDKTVNCCITSPPYYGLRDYGVAGQIGLEKTPGEYIERLVKVFHEVWRVLRDDGTLWLNIADSYAGSGKGAWKNKSAQKETYVLDPESTPAKMARTWNGIKPKDLIGIPWMLAFALRADGWYLRQDIIWSKPNPMPESVKDRCTKSHEYIFLLSKSPRYYYDASAIAEPVAESTIRRLSEPNLKDQSGSTRAQGKSNGNMKAVPSRYGGKKYTEYPDAFYRTKSGNAYEFHDKRNKRSVWNVSTKPFKGAHFATFPVELITPCVLAGCPVGGTVLDPFLGSGTTGKAATILDRGFIGIEINPNYAQMSKERVEHAFDMGSAPMHEEIYGQESLFEFMEECKNEKTKVRRTAYVAGSTAERGTADSVGDYRI